jgi:hypothetical protein
LAALPRCWVPEAASCSATVVVPDRPEDAVIPLEEGFDRPGTAVEQLAWLREAGLGAELVWTEQDLAVLRGDRPG